METKELILEIKKLSYQDKITLMERTLETLREDVTTKSFDSELTHAANLLLDDYINDNGLTSFTALDSEKFYEAR